MDERRRAWGWRLATAVALAGVGACGEQGGGGPGATEMVARDSAGVRIVEIPAGPVDTVPATGPVLTIGEEGDPRYEFDGVRLVAGLDDGRVAVVDHGALAVRYYDAEGRHVADVGRAGEGPGEFGFLSTAQLLPGDTIVVNDTRARRVSYLAPDMSFVRAVSYVSEMGEMDDGADMCVFPGWSGVMTEGDRRHVLRSWGCVFATGSEGPNWFHHAVRLWDPEGEPDIPVFEMPYMQNWERPGAEGIRRFATPQFFFVAYPMVWEGGIAVTHPMEHRLSVYGPDGALRMEIRDGEARRPTTAAHREIWMGSAGEGLLEATEGIPFPDSLPAFFRSVVDDDGRFWALHYDVPGMTGQHWRVYDRDGARLRVVSFPVGFEMQSVRGGRAFGIHEDDLGIQRPAVYQVPR